MMAARGDLVAGLRNAIERGSTIDAAKASFLAAGYIKEEVDEAASEIEKIAIPEIKENQTPAKPKKKKKNILLILIIIVAVLVLVGLALWSFNIIKI